MGIAALKKLNQNMPDGLKQLAAPVIRRQLTGNRIFLEQYEECERAKAMSEDELAALQLAKLQELLAFAYENVPYYRETFDEAGFDPAACADAADLQRLPLLTKSALRERFDDLQAESVTDYYLATTGGSTGEPTKVNLERASIYRERAFVYSFWARTGYDYRASRVATLRGVDFGGKIVKQDPLYGAILLNPFMLNESNVAQYVREIERFGATFLHGYPSAIQNFCRLLKKTGTRPPRGIKCAFFISEGVNERQMAIVREVLGCPTRTFYGHSERSVFAEQRGDALEYEFNPLYGVTEVVPHASGNVVCTGFLNRRMPLIRYAVDDWAERVDGATTIEGHHTADYLVGAGGERITQTALNFHDASMDAVMGYQMVQRRSGRATLRVCSDHVLDAAELAAIRAALERKVGESIVWDVEQVDELELTARGKVPSIVSSLAGETLRGGGAS